MKSVWVIIVNWNGVDNTIECLDSLRSVHHKNVNLHILVVDNASSDNSVEVIRRKFPEVELLTSAENLGFTGGNNLGIRRALDHDADYVWLLNNDTTVDASILDDLLPHLEDKAVGIVGPKIYFYPGNEFHLDRYKKNELGKVFWYAGGVVDWKNVYAFHRGVDEVDRGQYDEISETDYISGCSMLIKREVFEKIGLLDNKYFLYLEDLDFCIKAKRNGFMLLYIGKAKMWHKNAGSTAKPGNDLHEYYITRNRILFGMRYAPFRVKLSLLKQNLEYIIKGKAIRRRAVADALMGRYGKVYIWNK